jgi:hypothetical protein
MEITRFWGCWASIALLLPANELKAAESSRETSPPCPGAAAWREAHRDQLPPAMAARDQSRAFSAPELRAELQRRFEEDQRERQLLVANSKDRKILAAVQHMDADNLVWIKNLSAGTGIPTIAQVGESGVHWTWLLVQHADDDPQFQLSVQPVFAQRFGTQFDWLSGRFKPKGIVNVPDIESNRSSLGLMPLADYACMMNGKLKRE